MSRAGLRVDAFRTVRSLFVLPQVCFCFRSCLLNRTGVVVLMARQSCAASERLLAVCVWAFVWSLSRMDPAVSSQRG